MALSISNVGGGGIECLIDGIPQDEDLSFQSNTHVYEIYDNYAPVSFIMYNGNIHLVGYRRVQGTSYHENSLNNFYHVIVNRNSGECAIESRPPVIGQLFVENDNLYLFSNNKIIYKYDANGTWSSITTACTNSNAYIYSMVYYKGEFHVLSGSSQNNTHYKWNGNDWTQVSTIPYSPSRAVACVFDDKIHLIGGTTNNHYTWNGTTWTSIGTYPEISQNSYLNRLNLGGSILIWSENQPSYAYIYDGTSYSERLSSFQAFGSSGAIFITYDNGYFYYYKSSNPEGFRTKRMNIQNIINSNIIEKNFNYDYHNPVVFDGNIWFYYGGYLYTLDISIGNLINKSPQIPETNVTGNANYAIPVVYDGYIHVVTNYNPSSKLYKYDNESNEWTEICNLPNNNFRSCSAIVYNNNLHIIGGQDSSGYGKNHHYMWDGETWTSVSTLRSTYTKAGCVVKNNKIYLLGSGYGAYNNCYTWDGTTWNNITSPISNQSVRYYYAGIINNEIYLAFANNSNGTYFYKYDEANNTWSSVTSKYYPQGYYQNDYTNLPFHSVVYNDRFYIFDTNFIGQWAYGDTEWCPMYIPSSTNKSYACKLNGQICAVYLNGDIYVYDTTRYVWKQIVTGTFSSVSNGRYCVFNNAIYAVLNSQYFYEFNGISWKSLSNVAVNSAGNFFTFRDKLYFNHEGVSQSYYYDFDSDTWIFDDAIYGAIKCLFEYNGDLYGFNDHKLLKVDYDNSSYSVLFDALLSDNSTLCGTFVFNDDVYMLTNKGLVQLDILHNSVKNCYLSLTNAMDVGSYYIDLTTKLFVIGSSSYYDILVRDNDVFVEIPWTINKTDKYTRLK